MDNLIRLIIIVAFLVLLALWYFVPAETLTSALSKSAASSESQLARLC